MHGDPWLRNLVACCGAFVAMGCCYTLGLFAGLNFWMSVLSVVLGIAAWLRFWLRKQPVSARPADHRMLVVIAAVSVACAVIVKAHGAYDAWLHWNSLSKYLSDPVYFSILHKPHSLWHADYPPGLAATIGFIWRLAGTDTEHVPRVFSFLFYLAIPVILCRVALLVKGPAYLWVAILALFTLNYECVSQGMNQYADIPLALLFLLGLICWDTWLQTGLQRWAIACGVMLGGCLLMKNEGTVIVCAFMLSRIRLLLRGKAMVSLGAAMILPAAALVLYKRYIPTPADVVAGLGADRLQQLAAPERYRIIGHNVVRFGIGRFPLFIVFFGWVAWIRRRSRLRLDSNLLCLLMCSGAFLLVYLLTDIGLEWLVPTSLNRLMMQLLPAGVYVALTGIQREANVVTSGVPASSAR